jgi:hypothetical protein
MANPTADEQMFAVYRGNWAGLEEQDYWPFESRQTHERALGK